MEERRHQQRTRGNTSIKTAAHQWIKQWHHSTRQNGPSFTAALPSSVRVRFQLCAELQVDKTQVPATPWSLFGSDQKDGEFNFYGI